MTDLYKQFWEVANQTEAWKKIITADKENIPQAEYDATFFADGIPNGELALEIGPGVGRLMKLLSPKFCYIWGVDLSESMVELSKEYLMGYPCQVKLGNGHSLPVASNMFDYVYSFITFQHMPNKEHVVANITEAFRVLKPGGICRIQTIQGPPFQGEYGTGGMYGWYFSDPKEFENEFKCLGFETTLETGKWHPLAIWVTARKPNA